MTQGDRDSSDQSPLQRRLDQAIAEYLKAVVAGEPPDREAFIARYPDLAEHLRSFFAAQDQEQSSLSEPAAIASEDKPANAETISLPAESAAGYAETLAAPAPPSAHEGGGDGRAGNGPAPGAKVRYFGDYELLAEIARGGMGVVYKARQVSLNRIVALKMILAGQLAGEDDVRRFYTEAEAAANLDHPGIVPIYEVGQHEGQHYFSMGFVEGQSLAATLAAGPLPPREAAELVLKVTQAIAYAHERGVIHRDLKPGNILLDRNGEPRVTDFGLAKRVGHVSNVPLDDHVENLLHAGGVSALTAAGQILGTPSYMPPEQAAGKTDQIGPLADVYALGAVLYTLLTGRPPFQSASVVDTLLAVLEQEPVPPRQLNPSVPVDLESICLKCLEKTPKRRYASAPELARDLARYMAGEPVTARPVGRIARAARWVARHPAAASALGFAMFALVSLGLGAAFEWLWLDAKDARRGAEMALANETAANNELASANKQLWEALKQLRDAKRGVIEGELMRVLGRTGGIAFSQKMGSFYADQWSGNEQLFWMDAKPKDRLDLELPLDVPDRYDLDIVLTKARDYAIVQLYLDDKKLGEPIDLFNWPGKEPPDKDAKDVPDVITTGVTFAGQELTAGPHKLSVEIVGANPKAIPRYMFGLDYVRLRPAAAGPGALCAGIKAPVSIGYQPAYAGRSPGS